MNYIDTVAKELNFRDTLERLAQAQAIRAAEATRAESHAKVLTIYAGTLNERIMQYLKARAGVSRAVLADELCIRESSLCGRLHELVSAGYLHVGPSVYNPNTKRTVVTYWAIPTPVLSQDGNVRCALHGADLQVGIAAYGVDDAEALANFRAEYMIQRSGMCRG